MNKKERVWKSY